MATTRKMVGYLSIQIVDVPDQGVPTNYAPWDDQQIRRCGDCQGVAMEALVEFTTDPNAIKCAAQLASTLDEVLATLEKNVRAKVKYPPPPA